ncbi:spermidine synthase [Pyxidicoccus sp. MSG2]|uniref:spermidine synthase n=1 Tax=Pyxidicoccus sp. MSG2 TaxID=2996790 RepID=UPI002270A85F|nr:fused MFS/spermidine synthase [Pyxidicoccus sp. MSG2]MCY1021294.1 fused MFS/spermidine synthase [Pyxidicoccus sp. MSG2]
MAQARVSRALEHPRRLLHVAKSAGGLLVVSEDDEGRRYLQFGWLGASQSVVWPGFPLRLESDYTRAMVAALAFVAEPRRILVVGVGGGAVPMFLRDVLPQAHLDVVDLHPEVLDVARRYFGFREDAALQAHVADARRFIETPGPSYDAILLDAFDPRGIPPPLATREFLLAARARLSPGGVVVGNVLRLEGRVNSSMAPIWKESFAQLYAFTVEESSNQVLVGLPDATKRSRAELNARADRLTREWGTPFNLRTRMARRYQGPAAQGDAVCTVERSNSPSGPYSRRVR